jgi:hypothetical protein
MLPLPDNSKTMRVASQASISTEEDIEMGTMKSIMKKMFLEFKTTRKEMTKIILEKSRWSINDGIWRAGWKCSALKWSSSRKT